MIMKCWLKFALLAILSAVTSCQNGSVLRFGIQASPGQTYVDEHWFPMLNAAAEGLGLTAAVLAISTEQMGYDMVANKSLDYFYMGSALFNCMQTQYDIAPVVSSIQNVNSKPTAFIGSAMIARNGSGIEDLEDLRGARIALPQLSYLSSCQAQWFEMLSSGIRLFLDTAVVLITGTPQDVIIAVNAGVVDVGFVTAGDLDKYTSPNFVPKSEFTFVNRLNLDFPAEVSTRLYAGSVLAAMAHTDIYERTALAEQLLTLTAEELDANISRWTVQQNYALVRNIQTQLNVLQPPKLGETHGACLRATTIYTDYVTCPSGFVKDLTKNCLLNNLPCPAQYQCLCNPCVKIKPPTKKIIGSVIPVCVIVLITAYIIFIRCSQSTFENFINFNQLNIETTNVLGQSSAGLVLQGTYFGLPVALKRLAHTNINSRYPSPFDVADEAGQKDTGQMRCLEHLPEIRNRTYHANRKAYRLTKIQHSKIRVITGMSQGPSKRDVLLISPLMMNGTVYDCVQNKTFALEANMIAAIVSDVCEGLTFLHGLDMFGADVRSHHLLLDDMWHTRIVRVEPVPIAALTQTHKLCTAPEVISGSSKHDAASDVYAVGMLMYELFYRKTPYDGEIAGEIITSWRPPRLDLSRDRDELQQVMQSCWSSRPGDRPSISTLSRIVKNHARGSLADALFVEPSRSKLLLKSALPISVAVCLKEGRKLEPQDTDVSLCLIQLIDVSQVAVVAKVHRLWDELCQAQGLYRLNTIDNTYLVIGNLHVNQADHVTRIASFVSRALEALNTFTIEPGEAITTSQSTRKTVHAQSAIHCGTVTASILGYNHPKYVLTGTAMTILSRITSSAEPGHIQLSEKAAERLRSDTAVNHWNIHQRDGRIPIKGQGHHKTYWLISTSDMTSNPTMIRLARCSLPSTETSPSRKSKYLNKPADQNGNASDRP